MFGHEKPSIGHLHGTAHGRRVRMWQLYGEAMELASQLLPAKHALTIDAQKARRTLTLGQRGSLGEWRPLPSGELT